MIREAIGRVKTLGKRVVRAKYNALDLLRSDHMKVEAMLIQLRLIRDKERRKKLFQQIKTAVERHLLIEEEIFYPACAELPRLSRLIQHMRTDHQLVKDVLVDFPEINPASSRYNGLLNKLILELERHVIEEEDRLFPAVMRYMDRARFARLNREVIAAFERETPRSRRAA